MKRSVEKAATELLREHRVTEPPVPVEALAQRRGAEVRYTTFDGDISGLLLRQEESRIIGVHAGHAATRQRFTIAHELGHLELHPGRPAIVEHLSRARINWRDGTSAKATDKEEIEANQYAAALLMPASMVERDFLSLARLHPDDETVVERLSRRYQVSSQAMKFRLVNLALIDPL
jgi:Zn-dependent peptidase ImmA (M78 family)